METPATTLAVIIPCYRSFSCIEETCLEILDVFISNENLKSIDLKRIILVNDGADKVTSRVLNELSNHEKIDLITLNKNYGQHPAIFAGVLTTTEELILTMDEDGEHDPHLIPKLIYELKAKNLDIVYAEFTNKNLREWISVFSKKLVALISGDNTIKKFTSYRLVKGEIFRTAAIYANNGSFLDISIGWITKNLGSIKTKKRKTSRKSTYRISGLFSHFGKLFFASGIRPLIFLFNFGWLTSLFSVFGILYILYRRIFDFIPVQGWVSNTVVLMFFGGIIISALGLIARYVSSIVETSSGKPYFTIKNKSNG